MPSARPARDAARIALDRKHDLAVILEDVLIVLAVETAKPPAADSAAWIAHAQSRLTDAIGACDSLRDAITAAQAQVTKLARQVPVARDSPLRCHVQIGLGRQNSPQPVPPHRGLVTEQDLNPSCWGFHWHQRHSR